MHRADDNQFEADKTEHQFQGELLMPVNSSSSFQLVRTFEGEDKEVRLSATEREPSSPFPNLG